MVVLVPIVPFLILDTYYLTLERAFRVSYDTFVEELKNNNISSSDLYIIKPTGTIPKLFIHSLRSFSIYIFYPILIISVLIIWSIF